MTDMRVRTTAMQAWLAASGAAGRVGAEAEMPLARFVAVIEELASSAGNPMLGWQIGLEFPLEGLCEVAPAVRSARTLGGALQRLVENFGLIQDAADVRLECAGGLACLSYRILDPDIWPREQDALFTLGIFARILRAAVGPAWAGAELGLESEAAGLRRDGARGVPDRVVTWAETNYLRFPASWLDRPTGMPAQPAPDHGRLAREVARRRRRMTVSVRARLLIFKALHDGTCAQDLVARAMGMSPRTLRRRLAEEGTSFQLLMDECRMRLAAFEFRNRPGCSIAQTALRLGYSEHSTFTRAFQRWNGMPPLHYKRASQQAAARA